MAERWKVIIIVIMVMTLSVQNGSGGTFSQEPGPHTAILAWSLDIPCIVQTEYSQVKWEIIGGDSRQYITEDAIVYDGYKDKYELASNEPSNFTLRIKVVSLDEPQLRCEVRLPSGDYEYSDNSSITVVAPPYAGYPQCSTDPGSITSGGRLTLICDSAGGLPAATLHWSDGNTIIDTGPGTEGGLDANGRGSRSLIYKFKTDKSDNGKTFRCRAENTATTVLYNRGQLSEPYMECQTTASVQFAPEVAVGPAATYIVVENQPATLTCAVLAANPGVTGFRFQADSQSWGSWSSSSSKQVYSQTPRTAHSGRCRAKNSVGQRDDDLTILVHYPPEDVTLLLPSGEDVGEVHEIKEGDSVEVICVARDAMPAEVTYIWTKEGDGDFMQEMDTLQIDTTGREHAGLYTCTATNRMTPTDQGDMTGNATKTVDIIIEYPPSIVRTTPDARKSIAPLGSEVSLSTEVDAIPHPQDFTWWRVPDDSAEEEVSVDEFDVVNTNTSSTLSIVNITEDYYGRYRVTASNEYGDLLDEEGNIGVTFEVVLFSTPEVPRHVKLKVTVTSLTIDWDRGHDGGKPQTFHNNINGEHQQSIPDDAESDGHYTMRLDKDDGITASTQYTVSLYAENELGKSRSVTIRTTTKGSNGSSMRPATLLLLVVFTIKIIM